MTQATTAQPAVQRRPAQAGKATAGPRFLKLLAAIVLMPLLALLLVALFDLHLAAQLWHHPAAPAATQVLDGRRLTQSLPGLLGLGVLGLTLGLLAEALCAPERWLNRYGCRLLGGQEAAGSDGSFLTRWVLLQMPLWALVGLGLQAVLNYCEQPYAAGLVLAAVPFLYGVFAAHLARQLAWSGDLCKEDGTLFAWVSTALAQLVWLAMGLVFFLQARPLWQFSQDWFHAAAARAIQWVHLID